MGITQRIDRVIGRDELRDALDQKLIQWIASCGFIPVLIPNDFGNHANPQTNTPDQISLKDWLLHIQLGALILSGGNDVGEYPQRDGTESLLLSWAETHRLPVLGICRGMQMMAVWAGTSLKKIDAHVRVRHQLKLSPDTGSLPKNVNSYHNWCLDSCPGNFEVIAWAEDAVIEAIKHNDLPWEGWMWHPEREDSINPIDSERVKRLFGER